MHARRIASRYLKKCGAATLDGVLVRGTLPRESDKHMGRGIGIEWHPDTGTPASAVVTGSLVEQNHEIGVFVVGSEAILDALVVRDTAPRAADALFGDGVAVASDFLVQENPVLASAIVTHSRIENNPRAGIASFGAELALATTALSCNLIHLDGELLFEIPYRLEDGGGNHCGCPDLTGTCKLQSSGLTPPDAP